MRRLIVLFPFLALVVSGTLAHAKGVGARSIRSGTKTRIQGATRVLPATWGLVALGSGQLRILPTGTSKWQTVYKRRGDTLYRAAIDDDGRLLASWEKEPHFHLFVPKKKQDLTFAKPPAPSPEFKYGYSLEDFYFTKDGKGAIVYMHGFVGGRSWSTVAYHYDLESRSQPTLLFQQTGYSLHSSAGLAVYAIPKNKQDPCEHNSCHPLGAIIAWEIAGTKATKKILLSGKTNDKLSRVEPVWGGNDERVAVLVTEHPHKRHLLRWRRGEANAEFRPLPPGPGYDAEDMRLTTSHDVIETWLTDARGLEIRRHPAKGERNIVANLAPLPRRTPNDRPLFNVSDMIERKNGDLILYWGEYVYLLPVSGSPRRLDLRSVFKRKSEFAGTVIYAGEPEGLWMGLETGTTFQFLYISYAELEARAQVVP